MIETSNQAVNSPNHSLPRRSIPGRVSNAIKFVAREVLPQEFVYLLRSLKNIDKKERWPYLKAKIAEALKSATERKSELPKPVTSVLFVCFGNIMRSPMCEALMKRALSGTPEVKVSVTSAGVSATVGRPAHPWAIAAAHELGISLEHHRARLLTSEMLDQADVVFVMDYQNKVQLLIRYPDMRGKVMMLGVYAEPSHRSAEIRDPYFEGEEGTRRCYGILQTCVRNLVSDLSGNVGIGNREVEGKGR